MDSKDQVTLTSREQQLLADLERATTRTDPHLDAWLRTAKRTWVRWTPARQLVVAAVVMVAATALMLATFTRWLWVASLAAALQAASLGLGVRGWTRLRKGHSG